ncbi:hypothetical protein E2C01_101413 [Portunus trituberculatus]|uniref:Uncharacterized protein n=1 Tax=Portunus trituberculatus TaxID=210409 RepID=A0A5B7KK16_PORTR|nr:hypothetical protein [Portunus trituberculatus]
MHRASLIPSSLPPPSLHAGRPRQPWHGGGEYLKGVRKSWGRSDLSDASQGGRRGTLGVG